MIVVEQLGYRQVGVLSGSVDLIVHGQWLVGGVVFLVSVVLPLMKLIYNCVVFLEAALDPRFVPKWPLSINRSLGHVRYPGRTLVQ